MGYTQRELVSLKMVLREQQNETNNMSRAFHDAIKKQQDAIQEQSRTMQGLQNVVAAQQTTIRELRETVNEQHKTIEDLQRQSREFLPQFERALLETKSEWSEELKQALRRLDTVSPRPAPATSGQSSPKASYAEIARTPPGSQPSNVHTLSSSNNTPSVLAGAPFCTIDTSGVAREDKDKAQVAEIRKTIERELRAMENKEQWRCAAVTKEARNPNRVKVICRSEEEARFVKEAIQKTTTPGLKVLRDKLYPIKVDNANRTAVIDNAGNVLPGAAEALGTENEVSIARVAWLSKKDSGKDYGSMVVYLTKACDAKRLLDENYFHLNGESGYTNPFTPRNGPIQCYNCWEMGHKAFSCMRTQTCGRCAQQGHHHSSCHSVPTCKLCEGPHEAFSGNCPVRRPHTDA